MAEAEAVITCRLAGLVTRVRVREAS